MLLFLFIILLLVKSHYYDLLSGELCSQNLYFQSFRTDWIFYSNYFLISFIVYLNSDNLCWILFVWKRFSFSAKKRCNFTYFFNIVISLRLHLIILKDLVFAIYMLVISKPKAHAAFSTRSIFILYIQINQRIICLNKLSLV